MRKIATILSLALAAALTAADTALAQQYEGGRLGAKLGLVWADLDDDLDFEAETSNKRGFLGGVHFSMPLSGALSIQPELLYVEKGAEIEDQGVDLGTIDFTYIEIPLLGRFDFAPAGSTISAFVVGGPYAAFMIDCAIEDEFEDESFECGDEAEGIIDFSDTDYGIVLGGGLGYDIGRGWIFAEARYEMGLKGIEDEEDFAEDVDLNTRTFGLSIGIEMPLGAKRVR